MTFSDARVAAYVNANFVSAWYNRGPGFFNKDLSTERWISASSMEAYPTKNICTFFLDPGGRVFYYAAGHYSPDLFLRILQTAVELRQRLFDSKMAVEEDGYRNVRSYHEYLANDMEFSAREMGEPGMAENEAYLKAVAEAKKETDRKGMARKVKEAETAYYTAVSRNSRARLQALSRYGTYAYRGVTHVHGANCFHALQEGFRYLGSLHRKWAETDELPDLEKVRYSYLFGNPFTEESPTSRPIEDPSGRSRVGPQGGDLGAP